MGRMQELPVGAAAAAEGGGDDGAAGLRSRLVAHASASVSPFSAGPVQAEEASKPAFPGLAAGARAQGAKQPHSHLRCGPCPAVLRLRL
jgi:hypothetical protein